MTKFELNALSEGLTDDQARELLEGAEKLKAEIVRPKTVTELIRGQVKFNQRKSNAILKELIGRIKKHD
jgi:hypothetical protein